MTLTKTTLLFLAGLSFLACAGEQHDAEFYYGYGTARQIHIEGRLLEKGTPPRPTGMTAG